MLASTPRNSTLPVFGLRGLAVGRGDGEQAEQGSEERFYGVKLRSGWLPLATACVSTWVLLESKKVP